MASGHTADEVVAAIDEALAELGMKPMRSDRVGQASVDYLLPRLFGLEDPAYRADRVAALAVVNRDASLMLIDAANHLASTPESIARVVRRWLPPERRVRVVVTPDPGAPLEGVLRDRRVPPGEGR